MAPNETAPSAPTVEILTSLSLADVADLTRLLAQLSSTPKTEADVAQNMQGALGSRTTRTVVIRDETGRIQASATGNLCPILTGLKPWIDDVVTDKDHRGRGYGTALLGALHAWFIEEGAPYVNLTSTPDKAAGSLYEREGYIERRTRVYRLSLPAGAAATKSQTDQ